MSTTEKYYIGVDVGTGSARASLIASNGRVAGSSSIETTTYRDPHDHHIFEQSTTNIWNSISSCIKACLKQSKVAPKDIHGIGFDATCSLAVTDWQGNPIAVTGGETLGKAGERNVILWADHRAEKEADLINSTGSVVLDYVGGTMSLEMEIPKVLWLKTHMKPELFEGCQFFDLPDWLTYRATDNTTRSTCSVTCKCSDVPDKGWQADFFEKIGLKDLPGSEYKQMGAVGENILTAGLPVGNGLSKKAAEEFGLLEGTPVGSGLIDAYAGWMGTVAAQYKTSEGKIAGEIGDYSESGHRLAAVAGTSTCHIVQSHKGVFVPGVWGPYKNPVFRGWWMNEGGQSSTGQLIDFTIKSHAAYPKLLEESKKSGKNIYTILDDLLNEIKEREGVATFTEVTKDIHFYPDLHGNRSPLADSRMRGAIVGLRLDDTLHDLARKYNLALEAIALQTRHIVDEMNGRGHAITSIYMSGSQANNAHLMQLFADTCGMPVVLPADAGGAVVLGAAMLGRFADKAKGKNNMSEDDQGKLLWRMMVDMTPPGTLVSPNAAPKEKRLLEAKYKIFREQIDIQRRWRKEIAEASEEK